MARNAYWVRRPKAGSKWKVKPPCTSPWVQKHPLGIGKVDLYQNRKVRKPSLKLALFPCLAIEESSHHKKTGNHPIFLSSPLPLSYKFNSTAAMLAINSVRVWHWHVIVASVSFSFPCLTLHPQKMECLDSTPSLHYLFNCLSETRFPLGIMSQLLAVMKTCGWSCEW